MCSLPNLLRPETLLCIPHISAVIRMTSGSGISLLMWRHGLY